MPIIDQTSVVPISEAAMSNWKTPHRIEDVGGSVQLVMDAISNYPFAKLLYAEGDSWFDKFTPIPEQGTNLLSVLKLPVFAGIVDVSHIGDTSQAMVTGQQRRQTQAMFKLFDFDAILLSAGGNDLKNLFASLFHDVGEQRAGRPVTSSLAHLQDLQQAHIVDEHFDTVESSIRSFIGLRDASARQRTREAPLLMHGYDYLQPRPAPALVFAGSTLGAGPWIYPSLQHAGLTDRQMLDTAVEVVDKLNQRLRSIVASLPAGANVWVLDQRGLLTLAAPGSSSESGDWKDEIHASAAGYQKLARQRWNPWLARSLGLV